METLRHRRWVVALAVACSCLPLLGIAGAGAAPPPEPPSDADANVDYVAEPDDSVGSGVVAVGYGLAGRGGRSPARSRSLRFRGDSLEAGVRDGDGDPYGGADVRSRGGGRVLRIGRIAPAWGRGIVVGAPRDPWAAGWRGEDDAFTTRARGGDGAWCSWPRLGFEAFAGQFGANAGGGMAVTHRGVRLGSAAVRGGPASASASIERSEYAVETAVDAAGRWRAEAAATGGAGSLELALRARLGHEGFRAPLAPKLETPARAVALAARTGPPSARLEATLATWRFAAGLGGTRASLETTLASSASGAVSVGVEEQRGVRRASAAATSRVSGMLQGSWIEWRGQAACGALSVRDEWWGRLPFARAGVRRALAAGIETVLPARARLAVAHTVYRARAGETAYLPERDSDRWVLRALSGAGDRTRATLAVALAEGTLRGAVAIGRSHGRARATWSLQWTRSIRMRPAG